MWWSSPSKRRMLERMPKMIRFSPPTWESLHTSIPPMIGARLLPQREDLIMIIPMMTHQLGVTTRAIEPHLGQKPKLGGGIPTSHSSIYHVSSVLCISIVSLSFWFFVPAFSKRKNTKNIFVVSLG